jgi:tetratricopeptide (TPR) repeat protein
MVSESQQITPESGLDAGISSWMRKNSHEVENHPWINCYLFLEYATKLVSPFRFACSSALFGVLAWASFSYLGTAMFAIVCTVFGALLAVAVGCLVVQLVHRFSDKGVCMDRSEWTARRALRAVYSKGSGTDPNDRLAEARKFLESEQVAGFFKRYNDPDLQELITLNSWSKGANRLSDADMLYRAGMVLSRLGNHDQALECFEESISLRPQHPDALYRCGVALGEIGRSEDALKNFEKSLELRSDHVDTLRAYGVTLLDLHRAGDALKALNKCLERAPYDEEASEARERAMSELELLKATNPQNKKAPRA